MQHFKIAALVAATVLSLGAQAAPFTDTVQSPTDFFVPTDAQKYDQPYYRNQTQDWGWTHNAIAGTITSATLNISAFDVDAGPNGTFELDQIYALDSGTWKLLGALAGASDIYSFTEFVLGANFYDDIATGLQVKMDIDVNGEGWVVTLAKSSLSVDGGALPPPVPGIPEPETYALMLAGLGVVGFAARRRARK